VLALTVIGLPIYIAVSLLTGEGRRRLLGEVIALAVIVVLLSLLSGRARSPEDQETLLPAPFESSASSVLAGPPAEFTADVPSWVDALTAPALAVLISGAAVAVLWWAWSRAEVPRDTLDHIAEQAQATIDALQSGEAFDDVIIRCYVQLTRVIQQARAIQREKAMTPCEFEQSLIQRGFPAQPVRDLTRLFERVRYGRQPAGEAEERLAIDSLEAVIAFCKDPKEV